MTNKEAIEWIKAHHDFEMDCQDSQAMRLAIKALEERPRGDLISREWVIHNVLSLVDPETRIYAKQRLDDAPTVENITVFCENADEKAVADLKAELQNVIKERQKGDAE